MKKILAACSLLLVISACSLSQHQSKVIRPESLVNTSAEKISFPVSDAASVETIRDWVRTGDAPTSAEVSCADGNASCREIKDFLKQRNIAYQETTEGEASSISLSYNRLIARSCNLSSFGCATALNSVKMVTNRDQFIKPELSDLQDADNAVKAIRNVK